MYFEGVIAAKYDGVDIFGIWVGTTFVWPDPWTDIWDEGTTVRWENQWHDLWSSLAEEPVIPLKEQSHGDEQLT